ncbi:MAG: DUF692 domain-containing protein [Pseudomonadota bacterium]|nr:DUF692 domain-containing protein [Pseudomonadota bacterium]
MNDIRPNGAQDLTAHVGVGLRAPHYQEILEKKPGIGFLEVHSENFFALGGKAHAYLQALAEHYPISFHGVGLSLGSHTKPDLKHLKRLKEIADQYQPALVSEHVSWSGVDGMHLNDLLPLPYTPEALERLCQHIDMVQQFLGRKILMENPSVYVGFNLKGQQPEGEFLSQMVEKTGCGLLLDMNNVYVTAENLGLDATDQLRAMPFDAVEEVHLAGHELQTLASGQVVKVDSHGAQVADDVWQLYELFLKSTGRRPATLVEWDSQIPALSVLLGEMEKAMTVQQKVRSQHVA